MSNESSDFVVDQQYKYTMCWVETWDTDILLQHHWSAVPLGRSAIWDEHIDCNATGGAAPLWRSATEEAAPLGHAHENKNR